MLYLVLLHLYYKYIHAIDRDGAAITCRMFWAEFVACKLSSMMVCSIGETETSSPSAPLLFL